MKSKRNITARLIHLKEDDRSFDRDFWQQAGAEARFAAAWQMVLDMLIIRGEDVDQLRLQRSVENIERLRR
ncbi:MAG: hypothetical protein ONB11_10405 [candidate division KSB1 bacterium]|nr:hypothetical protein [candidate division KSB1 bacterium]